MVDLQLALKALLRLLRPRTTPQRPRYLLQAGHQSIQLRMLFKRSYLSSTLMDLQFDQVIVLVVWSVMAMTWDLRFAPPPT